jgi:NADH dehydrogenase
VPVEVALSSLGDERGLRAAMVDVDTVIHLAGGEWRGTRASLMEIDIQGTRSVLQAASEAGVKRFYYVSHLGADRASAYPVLKAKGIAEEFIRRSGMQYTILRTSIIFGAQDGLTTGIARLLRAVPFYFLVPGNGQVQMQPLWVEDLTTCLAWALEDQQTLNQTWEIGGPEYLPFNQIVLSIMQATGVNRRIVHVAPPYMRAMTVFFESVFPGLPVSVYWLDYLATNRTTALDTIPRVFNLMPSRFSQRLDYLQRPDRRQPLWRSLLRSARD